MKEKKEFYDYQKLINYRNKIMKMVVGKTTKEYKQFITLMCVLKKYSKPEYKGNFLCIKLQYEYENHRLIGDLLTSDNINVHMYDDYYEVEVRIWELEKQ